MTTRPFDVRALERENDPGAFPVLFDREYEMLDPKAMSFDQLFGIMDDHSNGKVLDALSKMVRESDQKDFMAQARKTPIFQLDALINAYLEHYQLKLPEAGASPPT